MFPDDPPSTLDRHHHSKHTHHPRTYDLPQFFGIVESQIYRSPPPHRPALTHPRSESLQPIHYPYIQALELTTILILSPEKPSRALKSFAEENNIKLVSPCWHGGNGGRFIWVCKGGNLIMHGRPWRKD